jgi:hypothetical protein
MYSLNLLPQLEGHIVPDFPPRRPQWICEGNMSVSFHHMPCYTVSHLFRVCLGVLCASAALAIDLCVALQHFMAASWTYTASLGEDLRKRLVRGDQDRLLAAPLLRERVLEIEGALFPWHNLVLGGPVSELGVLAELEEGSQRIFPVSLSSFVSLQIDALLHKRDVLPTFLLCSKHLQSCTTRLLLADLLPCTGWCTRW